MWNSMETGITAESPDIPSGINCSWHPLLLSLVYPLQLTFFWATCYYRGFSGTPLTGQIQLEHPLLFQCMTHPIPLSTRLAVTPYNNSNQVDQVSISRRNRWKAGTWVIQSRRQAYCRYTYRHSKKHQKSFRTDKRSGVVSNYLTWTPNW